MGDERVHNSVNVQIDCGGIVDDKPTVSLVNDGRPSRILVDVIRSQVRFNVSVAPAPTVISPETLASLPPAAGVMPLSMLPSVPPKLTEAAESTTMAAVAPSARVMAEVSAPLTIFSVPAPFSTVPAHWPALSSVPSWTTAPAFVMPSAPSGIGLIQNQSARAVRQGWVAPAPERSTPVPYCCS